MRLMSQQFRLARLGGSGQCAGEGGELGLRANACPTLIGEGDTTPITPIRLIPIYTNFTRVKGLGFSTFSPLLGLYDWANGK